jgi:lipopolysaccharide export system protein LptA
VVFLKQEKVGAGTKTSVDRIVVTGSVVMDQPGRRATGEELVYIAATDSFALTGDAARPPRVVDAKQGNVTGTALLFGDRGSTIVVSGDAVEGANSSAKHGRVRTETEVRQSNPK